MLQSIEEIVETLKLEPHPEGGYYRRTYKNELGPEGSSRGYASAIYFLQLPDFSRWHRCDGDELWFWHAGAPLTLELREDNGRVTSKKLGLGLSIGEQPQLLAPANLWQRARSEGDWTLVSCSVSPGFLFEKFEME